MSEGFKGGKIPPSTNFKAIKECICASSEVMMKKVEDAIVCQVHLKYDAQATIQSIIERLQYADKLEKALNKACEELAEFAELTNPLCNEHEYPFRIKDLWKEWCMKDD